MVSYDILAVDDEIHILNALRRSLRPEYNVFMATNGQNALAMMDQNDIPLIISDQRMPGMTGIELLRRVSLEHPGTIRLILTAYAADDNQHMLDAINSGQIHDCLAKPMNWLALLSNHISRRFFTMGSFPETSWRLP
jgi:response regulator RpfG family c-di-GMP phosphodiesterase